MEESKIAPYGSVIIKLLKGPLFHDRDKELWNTLHIHKSTIEEYMEKIGVRLFLEEGDGYAFLKQIESQEEESGIPRLTRAMPLSYDVSLLCVLLRERLYQIEMTESESSRIVITRDEIHELLSPYFKESLNEERHKKKLDQIVNSVKELGFLRELKSQEKESYKIERILKARVPADKLAEFKDRLAKRGNENGGS